MQPMVLVYLPTKLGDFVRANVGIHIPAPWSNGAYGDDWMLPSGKLNIAMENHHF